MKVLLTGGHFSPAYSLLKQLKSRGHLVLVAGRKYTFEGDKALSLEYIVLNKEEIPFFEIRTGRFQRKFTEYTLLSLFRFLVGIYDCVRVILTVKPDVVVTFGGYISLPVALVAFLFRVPIVAHDHTQHPGLANRIVGFLAQKICISFESSRKYFSNKKVVFTGNPIRYEVFRKNKQKSTPHDQPIICITGGSTGSHNINEAISKILPKLLVKYFVIHQTGDSKDFNDFERLSHLKKSLPQKLRARYILKKFIPLNEIGEILASSDLVITRAGINIFLELLYLRKTALFIPLSVGQKGEQLRNAKLALSLGLGEYIEEKDITQESLFKKINTIINQKNKYRVSEKDINKFIILDADKRIAEVVEDVVRK